MTTNTELPHRPEPLAVFLDKGGSLRDVGTRDDLVMWIELLRDCEEMDDAGRLHHAAVHLWGIDELIETGECSDGRPGPNVTAPGEEGWDSLQQYVTWSCWQAEACTDTALRVRIYNLLTDDERAKFAFWIDVDRHPHPLMVDRPNIARCSGCGIAFVDGDVSLRIGFRLSPDGEQETSEPDPPTAHCFECVTMAYEAMKAAQ